MNIVRTTAATLAMLIAPFGLADWQINNDQSRLSFVSTKASHVGEVHTFTTLNGGIKDSGEVAITIPLTSLDTGIEIRNDRMQSMLFESGSFPNATLSATVDSAQLDSLAVGAVSQQTISANLNLHDQTIELELPVVIAKLADNRLLVSSWKPVILNAGDFALTEGIEKLRTVAGLPSISHAVPVNFVLVLDHQ